MISAPTLKSDNGKVALTVRQLTNHLIYLKTDILDNKNITIKHLNWRRLHLNQFGSSLHTKNIISKLRIFWKSLKHLIKPNQSTKFSEPRNWNNKKEKTFSVDFNMKSQSPKRVSIYSHEVTCHSGYLFANTILPFKSN